MALQVDKCGYPGIVTTGSMTFIIFLLSVDQLDYKVYRKKYFGDEDSIRKTLKISCCGGSSKVTAVIKDVPGNSHFHFNMLSSFRQLSNLDANWEQYIYYTYARVNPLCMRSKISKLFVSLVILGILIACLGLLGLVTFSAQQRVKEIGIRKVLGASVPHVGFIRRGKKIPL